jgi:hypothetical protein
MAGLKLSVTSGEVALVAATAKTLLQIKAPTNQRVLVKGLKVMGKSAAGGTDTPVKIRVTSSSANFGTAGATPTPGKRNPSNGETPQSTVGSNFSAEPTSPTDRGVLYEVSPQSGVIEPFPFDNPYEIPGGQSLQVEATAPVGTPTIAVTLDYEE